MRADAVLFGPDGVIREDLVPALNDSNKTQVAKVSWLSSQNAGKAYGSIIGLAFSQKDQRQRDFSGRGGSTLETSQHLFGCSNPVLPSLGAINVKSLDTKLIAARGHRDVVIVLNRGRISRTTRLNQSVLRVLDLMVQRANVRGSAPWNI